MHKHQYVKYLGEKFIDLKVQFLKEINNGKNLVLLQELNGALVALGKEIQSLQNEELNTNKINDQLN